MGLNRSQIIVTDLEYCLVIDSFHLIFFSKIIKHLLKLGQLVTGQEVPE